MKRYLELRDMLMKPVALIPLVSVTAYLLAYLFEAAYLSYFGVSHQFIEISINIFVLSVCFSFLIMFFLGSLGISMHGALTKIFKPRIRISSWKNIAYIFLVSVPYVLATICVRFYLNFTLKDIFLNFIFSIVLIICLIFIFTKWDKKTEAERRTHIAREKEEIAAINSRSELEKRLSQNKTTIKHLEFKIAFISDLGRLYIAVSVVILLGILGGRLYALSRDNLLIYKYEGARYMLVRDYSDRMIFTSVDDSNKFTRKVLILNSKESSSIKLEPVRLKQD